MTKIHQLFPTQIYVSQLKLSKSTLKQALKDVRDLEKNDRLGAEWSKENYVGGYTSYGSAADLNHRYPSFSELCSLIDKHKAAFIRQLQWRAKDVEMEMSSCWINVMRNKSHHSFHIHPMSVLSGTLFLSSPRGASPFRIQDPRIGFFMNRPQTLKNSKFQPIFEVEPQDGLLVLFESWLSHEVPANKGKEERISLSFNYRWDPST